MRWFNDEPKEVRVYEKSMAERVRIIEVGAENNLASPLYITASEVGMEDQILSKETFGSYHININQSYYDKNKEAAESLIIEILKTTKEEIIYFVTEELLTDKIIETIKANDNIKTVSFCGITRMSKALLSRELINSISLCGYFDLLDLIEGKETIRIFDYIPPEELGKLKTLFERYPTKRIIISGYAVSQVNELIPIIKADKITIDDANMYHGEQKEYFSTGVAVDFIDEQKKRILRKNAAYRQTIENIEKCYSDIIEQYDNVEFVFNDDGDAIGSSNIKIKNKIYDAVVNDAKKFKLTPLEAYLYFYSVVKLFKKYKKEPISEISELSRKSEFVLFNDYIVCAGYTRILTELVDRYNDPNLMVSEYTCIIGNEHFHSRNIVEIRDREYNVIDMYTSDITRDQKRGNIDLFLDRLDYCLLTKQKIDEIDGRTRDSIPDCTDVLFYNQNGSNVSAKDFPTYAWDDAHYISWKFYDKSRGYSINSFRISDPFEIRQTPVPNEVIERALCRIHIKTFTRKSKILLLERIRWINHTLMFNRNLSFVLCPATYGYMVGEQKKR